MGLGHATGGDEALTGAFVLGQFLEQTDCFVARSGNKRAGINDDNIGICGRPGRLMSLGGQQAVHSFGVDYIFGAAEGNNMIFH
ncbi:MAG: hypothetical protein NVS2B7_13890 [Herpetosiphon sp.]